MGHRLYVVAILAVATTLLGSLSVHARNDIRTERLQFSSGSSSATVTGKIRGYQGVDYVVRASAGQRMVVRLKTRNTANYFNILPPGSSAAAIFIGSTRGNRYDGTLPKSGDYRIRVYMMRSAARRNETARYSLTIKIDGKAERMQFDARGAMPCSFGRPSYDQSCNWTVIRQGAGRAVIRVSKPNKAIRVLTFKKGKFSSPSAKLQHRKDGDFWLINVDDQEFYRFSNAVISGG